MVSEIQRRAVPDATSILQGDVASIAALCTLLERQEAGARPVLDELRPHCGKARRVVVTGPPGAGKSSLLRELLRVLRRQGRRVGVVACDPASPYSGGAFLGDRLRWGGLAEDEGLFLRSLAHRGAGASLSPAARGIADVLDAAGFEWIFIETVGAGQADVPVRDEGDRMKLLLVLSPGCGDEMQMLKAGILEAADVYVVNKVDQPGGSRWARQLEETLGVRVFPTAATTGEGVEDVVGELK